MSIPAEVIEVTVMDEFGMRIPDVLAQISKVKGGDGVCLELNKERTYLVPTNYVGDLSYEVDYHYSLSQKAQGYPTRQLKVNEIEDGKIVKQTGTLLIDMDEALVISALETDETFNARIYAAAKADLLTRFKS